MRHVLETRDITVAEAMLSETFSSMHLTAGPEGTSFTAVQNTVGDLVLGRLTYQMELDVVAEPLTAYTIGRQHAGVVGWCDGDEVSRYGAGDLFVSPMPGTPYTAWLRDSDTDFLALDPAALDEVAGTAPGDSAPLRLTGHDPVSPAAASEWTRIYDAIRDEVERGQLGRLAERRASHALALATLRTFPSNAWFDPTIEDRHDARPQTLRRAIAYIEAHPDKDVSVADIAEAAHVTVRAVQLAFRRHLGMTPMAYQRRVRLAHAHDDLVAGGDDTTVAEVAARWGFFNPGRFSAAHREEYGVLPRQVIGEDPAVDC